MMKKIWNYIVQKSNSFFGTSRINEIYRDVKRMNELIENGLIYDFLESHLYTNSFYTSSKRLTHYHLSIFSQNGEDGIISEIFRRLGEGGKYFVEFGAHGVKNNTTYLLIKGWRGLWIEASSIGIKTIKQTFGFKIEDDSLKISHSLVRPDNIETIFSTHNVPFDFDLLSIDIDGNDYWVWKALQKYRPRVVVIEYNGSFPPEDEWIMKYDENHKWDGTSYFGSSLKSLVKLAGIKGYNLVGCDFSGCNAFFVRSDQDLALFEAPFTASNHYEKPKYFLRKAGGHPPGFGPFESELTP